MKRSMFKRVITFALVFSMSMQNIAAYAGQMTFDETQTAESEAYTEIETYKKYTRKGL